MVIGPVVRVHHNFPDTKFGIEKIGWNFVCCYGYIENFVKNYQEDDSIQRNKSVKIKLPHSFSGICFTEFTESVDIDENCN